MEKEMMDMPERKLIDHRGPRGVDVRGAWYFITICAEERCNYGRAVVPPTAGPTNPLRTGLRHT